MIGLPRGEIRKEPLKIPTTFFRTKKKYILRFGIEVSPFGRIKFYILYFTIFQSMNLISMIFKPIFIPHLEDSAYEER